MTEDSIRVTAGRPSGSQGISERSERSGAGGPARTGRRSAAPKPPSELLVLAALALAILIAAAVAENFDAGIAWGFVTFLGAAYILSRGIARRGNGEPVL